MSCLQTHVERLAESSCEQVTADIDKQGDHKQWTTSFDDFYFTRGHHSNNSSAIVHDMESEGIAWFTHHTKRGKDSNWLGISAGATSIEASSIIDSSTVCSHFPGIDCGNHTAKSFYYN